MVLELYSYMFIFVIVWYFVCERFGRWFKIWKGKGWKIRNKDVWGRRIWMDI